MDPIPQVAVFPFRRNPDLEVLLIRRKPCGGWGIPKGHIDDHGNNYRNAAMMECVEEAGVQGALSTDSVGEFSYLRDGLEYKVRVLAMLVTKEHAHYREIGIRERQWFSIEEASKILEREALRWIVAELPKMKLP